MTKHPDNNAEDKGREPEDPRESLDEFDERIQEGLESDPRLDSGVAPGERGGDLDFIQMSGLTAPPPARPETPPPQDSEFPTDLDPGKPLSFFEEGVADVDSSMAPAADDASAPEREYPSEPDNRAAMEHLRDMIAELTKDEGPIAPPEDERTESDELAPVAEPPEEQTEAPLEAATPVPPVSEDTASGLESIATTPHIDEPDRVASLSEEAEETEADDVAPKPFELTPRAEKPEVPASEPETAEELASSESEPAVPEAPIEPPAIEEPAYDSFLPDVLEPEIPAAVETPAPPVPEEPRSPRVYAPPPPMTSRGEPKAEPPASPEDLGDRVRIPTVAEAEEAMYLRHNAPRTRRRHSGHRKHARRRVVRIAAGFIVLIGLAAGAYEIYTWYEANVSNPTTLYNEAAALAARGDYQQASSKFAAFAQRNPGSDLHADAQFAAAFTLQQVQLTSKDESTRVYSSALELFQAFLDENPTHVKAPRARTLMGRLHYELGQYQEAIELLRDPELRLLDPIAAVPAVRLLARSYAKLGQDDSARSYYLQAVGLQDNHTPDVDYMELGTLYRSMAERASVTPTRREYEQLAAAQWTHAVQSPGIDPATKKELRAKIDVLREQVAQDPTPTQSDPTEEIAPELSEQAASAAPIGDLPWESMAPALEEDAGATADEDAEWIAPPDAESEGLEPVEPAPATETVHRVVAGDTLSEISAASGVSVADLMEWNNLSHSVILVGQDLILHGPNSQASDPSESVDENEEANRDTTS